jgi:hypothetical protein
VASLKNQKRKMPNITPVIVRLAKQYEMVGVIQGVTLREILLERIYNALV